MINTKELQSLLAEASELSTKPNWTKQDERRNAYLLAAISAVKSGVSLVDINVAELNDVEDRMGVERTLIEPRSPLTREQREHIGVWQRFHQKRQD